MIVDTHQRRIRKDESFITSMGHFLQTVLPTSHVNRLITRACDWFHTSTSRHYIPSFAERHDIPHRSIHMCKDMNNPRQCWNSFRTFNDFFKRCRVDLPLPIPRSREVFSPADAYTTYLSVQMVQQKIWVKHERFSVQQLFQHSSLPDTYHMFISRLAVHHYHRVHSPVSGVIRRMYTTGQDLYSVHPNVVHSTTNVLNQNVRCVFEIQPSFTNERVFIALIGATCVGSIHLHVQPSDAVMAKQELGYFQMGGSCVVVLCPEQIYRTHSIVDTLEKNTRKNTETEITLGMPLLQLR